MSLGSRFAGASVLLTGIGRPGQMGEVVARTFLDEGARVLVVARDAAEAETRAADMRRPGDRIDAFGADLADAAALEHTAEAVRAAVPDGLDALVHMAGGFAMSGPVAESDPAVWDRMIAINLTTAYLTTRAFLPQLRPRRGAIVYFAAAAVMPGERATGMAAYLAAKNGVVALMRAVATEERASGVRANAVAPTVIRTATNIAAMGDGARFVEREEVAAAVLYLCSEGGRPVNGQLVRLG